MRVIYKYIIHIGPMYNCTCFIEYNVVKRHNIIINILLVVLTRIFNLNISLIILFCAIRNTFIYE